MKDSYIKILFAVLTLTLGSVLGHWTKSIQDEQANKMRYLDIDAQIHPDIIERPNVLGKKMDVFIDGQKIDNLSQIDIKLYNFTDKDLAEVPLVVELLSNNGDSIRLLNAQVAGQEGLPDFIQTNQELEPPKHKGAIKFSYKIKTLNRIGNSPVFSASYLIIGKADNWQINTMQANLDLQKYNYEHFQKPSFWGNGYVILAIFIIIYGGIITIAIRSSAKRQIKSNIKFGEFLAEHLKLNGQVKETSITSDNISKQVIKLKNIFDWQTTKKFIRFIEGRKNPEE